MRAFIVALAACISVSAIAASQRQVFFIGSSSISSWESIGHDFPGIRVYNYGVGGSELRDWANDTLFVPNAGPRHRIVLYAGENDLQSGRTPEEVCDAFTVLAAKVSEARIVYVSIKPSPSRWERLRDKVNTTNECIRDRIAADSRLQYADVYSLMLNERGEPNIELFQEDMLHMNRAGYDIWKSVIAPLIR